MTNPRSAKVLYLADVRRPAVPAMSFPDAPDPGIGARRRIAIWVGASLLLHALALGLLAAWLTPPEPPAPPPTLRVVLVTGPAAVPETSPAAAPSAKAPAPPRPAAARRPRPPAPETPPEPSPATAQSAPQATSPPGAASDPPIAARGPFRPPAQAGATAAAGRPEPKTSQPAQASSGSPTLAGGPSPAAPAAPGVAAGLSSASSATSSEPALVPPSFSADYLENPPPAYPLSARRLGQSGLVLLRVLVSESGKPAEVRIAKTAGVDALDRAALEAVRGWTFVPARRGEAPVAAWVEVPLRFRLDGPR